MRIGRPDERGTGGEATGELRPRPIGADERVVVHRGVLAVHVGGEVDFGEVDEEEPSRLRCQLDRCVDSLVVGVDRLKPGPPVEGSCEWRGSEMAGLHRDRLDGATAQPLPEVRAGQPVGRIDIDRLASRRPPFQDVHDTIQVRDPHLVADRSVRGRMHPGCDGGHAHGRRRWERRFDRSNECIPHPGRPSMLELSRS